MESFGIRIMYQVMNEKDLSFVILLDQRPIVTSLASQQA
jgi:hypothetical protein